VGEAAGLMSLVGLRGINPALWQKVKNALRRSSFLFLVLTPVSLQVGRKATRISKVKSSIGEESPRTGEIFQLAKQELVFSESIGGAVFRLDVR
jgi:hypothetical protein